jgi:general secretion pathway protein G
MQTPDVEIPASRKLQFLRKVAIICVGGCFLLPIVATGPQFVSDRNMIAKAKIVCAKGDIEGLKASLVSYQVSTSALPTTTQGLQALLAMPEGVPGWRGPYADATQLVDPWGKNFIYVQPGTHNPQGYDIYSAGPDGRPNTRDDIGSWGAAVK